MTKSVLSNMYTSMTDDTKTLFLIGCVLTGSFANLQITVGSQGGGRGALVVAFPHIFGFKLLCQDLVTLFINM